MSVDSFLAVVEFDSQMVYERAKELREEIKTKKEEAIKKWFEWRTKTPFKCWWWFNSVLPDAELADKLFKEGLVSVKWKYDRKYDWLYDDILLIECVAGKAVEKGTRTIYLSDRASNKLFNVVVEYNWPDKGS